MQNNNSFSINRLWLLLKCDILSNRKQYLLNFVGLIAMYTAILLLLLTSHPWSMWNLSVDYANLSFMGTTLYACFYMTTIMKPMSSKTKRISFLMLPATTAEKFISRLLIVTVGMLIMAITANILVMPLHYLIAPILGLGEKLQGMMIDNVITYALSRDFCLGHNEHIFGTSVYEILGTPMAYTMTACFTLFGYSAYMLGGNIWYKHPFLKTVSALISLFFIVLIIIIAAMSNGTITEANSVETAKVGYITATIITGIGFILNCCISYRLFKRAELKKKGLFL